MTTAQTTTVRRPTAAGAWLVAAAVAQLVGQAVLRLAPGELDAGDPRSSEAWVVSHVVLVLAAVALVVAVVLLVPVIGRGPGTWLGLGLVLVGQALTLVVLAIDLTGAAVPVEVIRGLDVWDFLAVVGLVVLLLELRRRQPELATGASLALLGLAVPPVQGLVLAAAAAVVVGFASLARDLGAPRRVDSPTWLAVVVVGAYAVAGALVSWQRAALAVLVLSWTIQLVRRARASAPAATD